MGRVRRAIELLFFSLLVGCTSMQPHQPWVIQSIATGDPSFDTSRLRYGSSQAHPPMLFEFIRIGKQIDAFLTLTRFRFSDKQQIKITFTIQGDRFEDLAAVHEGAMRVRLSPESTERLIQALQDGREVAILVDGFEETLDPAQFSGSFAQFLGEGLFLNNFLKGMQ